MDDAALVHLAQRRGDADGQPEEAPGLNRRAEDALERLPARILDQELNPAAILPKLQRPCGPSGVKLVSQFKLMGESIEHSPWRTVRGRKSEQNGRIAAFATKPSSSAEDALAVVRKELEIADSVDAKLKFRTQFLDPAAIGKRASDCVAERGQAQLHDKPIPSAAVSGLPRVARTVRIERGSDA